MTVSTTRTDARQRRVRHVLQEYGVLTHDTLRELCHADGWEVPFDVVLTNAMTCGRVKRLSDGCDLFEAGEID
jgi:hypothetical protein